MKGGRKEEVSGMNRDRRANKLGGDLEVRNTWVPSLGEGLGNWG
jgi:hypothetical protein